MEAINTCVTTSFEHETLVKLLRKSTLYTTTDFTLFAKTLFGNGEHPSPIAKRRFQETSATLDAPSIMLNCF